MACVALASLISTINVEFLLPTSRARVSLHDRSSIISFVANLSCLQAFLQMKKSKSKGNDKDRDLEIEIRDFALKAEDDIEIQLSNFAEEAATSHDELLLLHQTLGEAAKNAEDLLKIIAAEKESNSASETEMGAIVALTFLLTKFNCYLQPFPTVCLGDNEAVAMQSFLLTLHYLQGSLLRRKLDGGATIKIRNFALKAESDIQIQLSNFLRANHTEHEQEEEEEASLQLLQTLQGATENANKLLTSILSEKACNLSIEITCMRSISLISEFKSHLLKRFPTVVSVYEADMEAFKWNLDALHFCLLLLQRKSNGGATAAAIKISNFTIKPKNDIQIQLSNFRQAKDTEHEEEEEEEEEAAACQELRQTIQEAAETAAELLMSIISEKEFGNNEIEIASFALSSLMPTIEKFVHDEVARKSFLEKISSLQAFLRKPSLSSAAAMKLDLATKIKHFALTAKHDIKIQLNNFLPRKAEDTVEYEEKVSQELHQTMQEAAERAAELLKIINTRRSNEEVDDDEANEAQPPHSWLKLPSKSANVEPDNGSSRRFLKLKYKMVGRHHDCRVIKDQLLSNCRGPPKIITIVGMVGIGKTTVARNVYEDPLVASHFDVRGWVTIPQEYNKSQMLSELLQSMEPNAAIKNGSTPDELEMQVHKCLLGRRFLIVLDNVLSNKAWPLDCFPIDFSGSCILLTTSRYKPEFYNNKFVHNMTFLDPKESWELFCNILSIDEEKLAPKFEQIRNPVVKKCDGLPQLIVEVAERLSKCNNIQQGWKKIEKELESLGFLDRNALMVSYNSLPHHLKVCFLYFGVFPKRNKIPVTMLIRLWIAEGLVIKPFSHMGLEGSAYVYLHKLINRNLLLIEDRSSDGEIRTCRMHSAMHSFCVGEAQKEGILCAVNTQQHSGLSLDAFANSCRWLSIYSHSFDYYVLFGTNIPRSIFFFHENPEVFVPPKMLRVLAFDTSISLQRVPVQLCGLVFLRYLSITQWFEDLNDVVSNNPNLETLVVYGNGAPTVHLPSSIWKPLHLRHLKLGNSYMVDPPSADRKSLQTLSWVVRPVDCRKEVYNKFPNIKNLKILLKDGIETPSHIEGCCSNPIILDHFDYFKWLEKLSISVSIGCNAALPELARFPSGLKKLKLSGINISEWDLNVIATLPELKVLKLENAFHGTVWKVADGGFPELIFLLLEAKELKQWALSSREHHFPKLRHLVLRSCNCLEQMPKHFVGYELETIELEGCHSSLVASVKQLQRISCFKKLKIKILGTDYDDESLSTDTYVSIEDELESL